MFTSKADVHPGYLMFRWTFQIDLIFHMKIPGEHPRYISHIDLTSQTDIPDGYKCVS